MASTKSWKPWLWASACLVLVVLIYLGCRGSFPPKAYVGDMEANHPWLVFQLASYRPRIYIFSRAEMKPKRFDPRSVEKVLEKFP